MSTKISGSICVWGDSIVWGAWDTGKSGWVNRLRLHFDKETNGDVIVYNLGIPGDNTDNLTARFEAECKARQPEVILFAVGINDSSYSTDRNSVAVPIEKFRENLEHLIDMSKRYSKKIGFIGLTKVNETKTMPITWDNEIFYYYKNDDIERYDCKLKNAAESKNVSYLYMFDLLNPEDFEDGLHPDTKSHEKMFERVKEFLYEKF